MHLEELYPLARFRVEDIYRDSSQAIVIKASRISREAICPYCQTPSRRRHSQYQRNPQALPCAGEQIHLVLVVQRYFCKQPKCSRSTFAERIPDVVQSHGAERWGWSVCCKPWPLK